MRQHLVPKKTQMEKIYIKYLGIAVWAELQSCIDVILPPQAIPELIISFFARNNKLAGIALWTLDKE